MELRYLCLRFHTQMKFAMRSYWILLLGLLWAQDGKALFQANCASCHAINRRVVGPALKGVHERWGGDEAEMTKFIKNSQAYINGNFKNSAYAKKLYEQYNKAVMTAFTGLSDAEIKSILDYIKAESQAQEATAAAAPSNAGTGAAGGGGAEVVSPILWVLVLALGAIAIALLITTLALSKLLRPETEASAVPSTTREGTIRKILRSRSFIGLVSVGAFIWLMNATIKKARSVGLHKGYQPVQPIAFSHKTHAGEYKIACQYCHVGVEKGKSATIPSTNICMNCHTYIQEGSRYGKKEIAKILASWEQGKPIEWVRIHNLPDFVYFSHAQHVKVGGIACQTCHGPVQEMEEVYQYSDLSMGWCLDCHRQTKVDLTANPYYARLHEQLKEKEVTVEKIGGLECSKCHY
ncbi:MAG: c-type cytochrome [Bacteroidia bacterium]|nr:c-type cytochrome [Bacteroidia bacterium]MDW8057158.1 c-type cytochrome [Bacteroidia bacterium]